MIGIVVIESKKYKKQNFVVEAMIYTGKNSHDICTSSWGTNFKAVTKVLYKDNKLQSVEEFIEIPTKDGDLRAYPGYYIVKNKGRFYPFIPDLFESIFEKLEG